MYFVIYVSAAVAPFQSAQLHELLATCDINNRRAEISGMLLYKDGNFMQMLEGPEAAVREVLARIERDPRHRGLITLEQGPQAERQFPAWTMGFSDLSPSPSAPSSAFSEFMQVTLTGDEFSTDPSRAQKLLMTFKANS